jgi:hypothetical protein
MTPQKGKKKSVSWGFVPLKFNFCLILLLIRAKIIGTFGVVLDHFSFLLSFFLFLLFCLLMIKKACTPICWCKYIDCIRVQRALFHSNNVPIFNEFIVPVVKMTRVVNQAGIVLHSPLLCRLQDLYCLPVKPLINPRRVISVFIIQQ